MSANKIGSIKDTKTEDGQSIRAEPTLAWGQDENQDERKSIEKIPVKKKRRFLSDLNLRDEEETFVSEKEQILKAMFHALDSNGTGFVSLEELKILDGNLFIDHSETFDEPVALNIQQVFSCEEQKAWTYLEFVKLMSPYVRLKVKELSRNSMNAKDQLWEAFVYPFLQMFNPQQAQGRAQRIQKLRISERKIVHSWTMWPAKSDQAYISPILLIFLFCYQLFPVTLQVIGSEINRSPRGQSTFLLVCCYAILLIMIPLALALIFNKKFRVSSQLAMKHLQGLGKSMFKLAVTSYLVCCITLFFGSFAFQQTAMGKYYEFVFPWLQNTFCLMGITIITLYNLSEESELAGRRDLILLGRDKFTVPTENIKTARDLVLHMEKTCATSRGYLHEIVMFIRNLAGPILYCVLLLVIPRFDSLQFIRIDMKTGLSPTAIWPDYVDFCYMGLVVGGALTMFLSSYALDKAISKSTFTIFKKNAEMMKMLLSTTSSIESAMNNLPFCILYRPSDLRSFLHVHSYLKKHEQDKGMGQASAGFAGILLVDVAVILISLIITRADWYRQLMPGYYAVFATAWCFVLIGLAVEINSIHEDTLSRLIDYQAEVSLLEEEGTEATALLKKGSNANIDGIQLNIERVYNMLSRVQSSVSQNFKPVTVLGIAATPTLSRLFFGYLVTAVFTYLAKNVFKFDFLPI